MEQSVIIHDTSFLAGGGEMGALTRAKDWSKTLVGPVEDWPQSLRTTLNIILNSKFPMFLWWGPELTCFYNDAYRPSLGQHGKHPSILGMPGVEAWSEIWHLIGPLVEQVLKGGEATWNEDMLVPIYRNGRIEDVYWTFSYSPVHGETGQVAGVLVTCNETTDKVYAFRSLEESNRRYYSNIMQAPVAMCILRGKDSVVELANDGMLELWGKTAGQVMKKPLFEGLPEAKNQGIEALIAGVLNTGERFEANERPVDLPRNGKIETTYINFAYEALKEPDGTISGIVAIANDVTAQVLTRKKIEESEQRFRNLVESAPFPLALYTGREMRVELANQAILDVWGKGNDVMGKLFSEVLPELGNQDVFKQLDEVYMTGKAFHVRNKRLDLVVDELLQPYYFNYSLTPLFDATGNVYAVMNTGVELSDLNIAKQKIEESEKRFRKVADTAPVMIRMSGTDKLVNYLNKAWLDFTGRKEEQEIGSRWAEGLHADDVERVIATYTAAFETHEEYHMQYRLKRHDSVYRWVSSKGVPRFTSDGVFEGYISACTDIHDQKMFSTELEKMVEQRTHELEERNTELVKMNMELQSFAYVSSHDLQEPLRKIQTFASRILEKEKDQLSENGKYYFTRMQGAAYKMQQLINDLLTYSRAHTSERKFEPTQLNKIMEEIKEELKDEIQQKYATIEMDQICTVNVIPFQFRQLLFNLVSNSLKFSRENVPPVIKLKCKLEDGASLKNEKLDTSRKYCHISITDNGVGFDPQYSEKIFEVFQRLHLDSEYSGTGIGLAIVKKIVNNHNGFITATGELNGGSTFDIYIPAV